MILDKNCCLIQSNFDFYLYSELSIVVNMYQLEQSEYIYAKQLESLVSLSYQD